MRFYTHPVPGDESYFRERVPAGGHSPGFDGSLGNSRSAGFLTSAEVSRTHNTLHFPLLCLLTLQGFFFPFILVDSSENSQDFLTSLLSLKHRLAEVWVGRSSLFYSRVFYLFSCPPHLKVLKTLGRICTSSLACLPWSIFAWF